MKVVFRSIFLVFFVLLAIQLKAQPKKEKLITDSLAIQIEKPVKIHLPRKATMYSAVLPGLGQIYNKQWWKTPFIYAGFATIGYFIYDNNLNYKLSKQGYLDIIDNDLNTTSYLDVYKDYLEENNITIDETNATSSNTFKENLDTSIDQYKRSRNIYVIAAAGFYLLNILDANVNAHFLDFDISEDLSLNIQPLPTNPMNNTPIPGVKLVYNF
ncbi:MAG: DUF5683 domain-containing protein [Prolixibacteraceae bacterium]|nr:DUF5683 domain-containing protein [Prolixibacteraceae bacterium]